MAKKIYVGVDGVARKVKKAYIGVNDQARKVKKAYLGVGGKARPVFSGGELVYYGSSEDGAVMPLSEVKYNHSAVSIGDHVLFAGGGVKSNGGTGSSVVNAYDDSLIRTVIDPLQTGRCGGCTGTAANYAILAGGYYETTYGTSTSYAGTVEFYDQSLTHSYYSPLSGSTAQTKLTKSGLASASLESVCIFGGGKKTSSSSYSSDIFTFDQSHTLNLPTRVSAPSGSLRTVGAAVGDTAIFTNGSTTYSYDSALTAATLNQNTALSGANVELHTGISFGNYALFTGVGKGIWGAGKWSYLQPIGDVYTFDESLTEMHLPDLIRPIFQSAAAVLGKYALIGYGNIQSGESNTETDAIEVIDTSLTRIAGFNFGTTKSGVAAGSVGNFAVFAGGIHRGNSPIVEFDAAEIFTIS